MQHLAPVVGRAPDLFAHAPAPISRSSCADELGGALGATLYTPATALDLPTRLRRLADAGLVSSVLCLEDSIRPDELPGAVANLVGALRQIAVDGPEHGPLRFVRLRSPDTVEEFFASLGFGIEAVDGLVLPKFGPQSGARWLQSLDRAGVDLPFMPVIEDRAAFAQPQRGRSLLAIRQLLDDHCDRVIAVRFGATDISGFFGLRRSADQTMYDLAPVSDCLVSLVNACGGQHGFVISGAVWEHFEPGERLWKPQLRHSPFPDDQQAVRDALIADSRVHLVREARLDLSNGLVGKSIIHPSHALLVDACHTVTAEEHRDALAIVQSVGGASASPAGNKMNEAGPHGWWAQRTLRRGRHFGVLNEGCSHVELFVEAAS